MCSGRARPGMTPEFDSENLELVLVTPDLGLLTRELWITNSLDECVSVTLKHDILVATWVGAPVVKRVRWRENPLTSSASEDELCGRRPSTHRGDPRNPR